VIIGNRFRSFGKYSHQPSVFGNIFQLRGNDSTPVSISSQGNINASYSEGILCGKTFQRLRCGAISGGATLWQSSANALPVCCHALPIALPPF